MSGIMGGSRRPRLNESSECAANDAYVARTQREQLQDQLANFETRAMELREAIALLDKHPEIERLLTLMRGF